MERIRIEARRGRQRPQAATSGARIRALCFDRGALDRSVYLRRRLAAVAVAVVATVLLWLLLFGGDDGAEPASGPPEVTIAQLQPETQALLAGLDDEGKVDQLILAADPPADGGAVGGALVSTDLWQSSGGSEDLIKGFHDAGASEPPAISGADDSAPATGIPAMVGTTQEGGTYRELPDLPPEQRAIEIGDAGDPKAAERWGAEMAQALRKAGFDFNIGPLADIATLDSAIADRAFSDDPATVDAMVGAAFSGCADEDFACIPAHFPGQGATAEDTAAGPASVSIDAGTLASRDLLPFESAFAAGAPAVVVSNAFFAAYDPVTPASLSPEVLDGLLRKQLGFTGVAITGDLLEGAIRSGYKVDAAAVAAVVAGADMVQLSDPDSIEPVRQALLAAVGSGEISTDRLNSAAGRVIEMKQALGLLG